MCPACRAEYEDPANRRFHAQPIACPDCGPHVQLEIGGKVIESGENAIQNARSMIKDGRIVAIKGLGGYLLACDASNPDAVAELRRRKMRSQKPFALMAFDMRAIEKFCSLNSSEPELLNSIQHPIVLLQKKNQVSFSESIAPRQKTLGFMLPYTPLHLLLLEPGKEYPEVLVMTSGNISEEPISYKEDEARQRLHNIADAFLTNNRKIHMRTDDSVVSVVNNHPYISRRARGYAPDSIRLPYPVPSILGTGAELKNTFCLARDEYAFPSHHIGDLQNYETLESFESCIRHFESLFRVHPELIVCDLHPNYLSTRYARNRLPCDKHSLVQVQHHHAHLAACLADNHWAADEPVIGICFNGTGYGADDTIWGGEILVGGYKGYERVFHLNYMPLPGGDTSIHKPYRIALAYLWKIGLDWEIQSLLEHVSQEETRVLRYQLDNSINIVNTSSMGRLFDAVSAMLGICRLSTYEGQAAIELETMADPATIDAYEINLENDLMDFQTMLHEIIADLNDGVAISTIAGRFHNTISQTVLHVCEISKSIYSIDTVALSGGVWQNRLLLEKTLKLLKKIISRFSFITRFQPMMAAFLWDK